MYCTMLVPGMTYLVQQVISGIMGPDVDFFKLYVMHKKPRDISLFFIFEPKKNEGTFSGLVGSSEWS